MSDNIDFDYDVAFSRNRGLISTTEQDILKKKRVVIAGCGGVGGAHAHTLARLGVGKFRVCDPDTFSVGNFNRQFGATLATVGENKAEVIVRMIRAINPESDVEFLPEGIGEHNIGPFLDGADLVIDGIDFFSLPARRLLFSAARKAGIPALTAAPLGFSGTLLTFTTDGMSFDEYFDLNDQQSYYDQIVNFLLGLAPAALHIKYMDISGVDPETGRGPSSVVGVQMAACLVGAEAIRILLGRAPSRVAPCYLQFDAYRQKLAKGRLPKGNRGPLQRLKRRVIVHQFRKHGLDQAFQKINVK